MNYQRVEILMATYNGARYIRQQLDSLLSQTYPYWRLIIHDDGSTDATLAIIDEYRRKDVRVTLLEDDKTGLGSAGNFLHLMEQVEGTYYMFCDQDDIWFDDKVEKMLATLIPFDGPAAVYSNAYLYTSGQLSSQKSTLIHPRTARDTLFFNSGVQGCAVIFNRQLMEVLRPFPDFVAMHDHLVTLGAVTLGEMAYLDEVLMWYRQHALNVTGNQANSRFERIKSFLSPHKPVIDRAHFEANRVFYQRYSDIFSPSSKRLFEAYFRYAGSKSLFARLFILLRNGFTLGNKRGVLFFKTLFRKPIG